MEAKAIGKSALSCLNEHTVKVFKKYVIQIFFAKKLSVCVVCLSENKQ